MNANKVQEQLNQIKKRIDASCRSANRNPDDITLLLATKTVSAETIKPALDAGETLLGENKAQELQEKYPLIEDNRAQWHFIGHLQTNKINNVLPYVTCIQSVDRLKLAQKLHNRLLKDNRTLDILVQVNTSYEESKFGAAPEHVLTLIEQLSEFSTLHIKGLMTIGKLSANSEETRESFRLLKSLQEQVKAQDYPGVDMGVLSMGMSGDLEAAIEEGATMIRVGTAIFGDREYPDSYYWNEQLSDTDD
ncbi:YggS family pyridoxal phosphate-dependent enzyme [Barrientosiimonas marina]|uniref:Pyridoxal phosphate homeostasis protein n=1 Tax=Lentibacillus kimchii TaxID=1542911 RepID=A0ABW2UTV0_9BACI